jgi:hypothetical protein
MEVFNEKVADLNIVGLRAHLLIRWSSDVYSLLTGGAP